MRQAAGWWQMWGLRRAGTRHILHPDHPGGTALTTGRSRVLLRVPAPKTGRAAHLRHSERTISMASPHLDALTARHAQIDGMIAAEMHRPLPDSTRLAHLKRQKLKLKEEVTGLQKG
jgi:hypothetical protein